MRRQDGFTLVETVLAMAIFAFATLVMSIAVIRLYKMYQTGIQTRSTQQAARFIAEKVSRDARAAEVVAVGGAGARTAVCTVAPIVISGTATLTGFKYYTQELGQNSGVPFNNTGRIALYRGEITIPLIAPSQAALNAACGTVGVQNPQLISADDVSIVGFSGHEVSNSAAGGVNLLEMTLAVAAKDGQSDIQSVGADGIGLCTDGQAEYCSITNLQFSAGSTGTKYGG